MADKPEAADGEKAPAKSKKMIVIGALVGLILVGAGGGFWFMKHRAAATEEGAEEPAPKAASHDTKVVPPAYLPMENMVVNLADPGGERVAQIGITLVVADAKASDQVKAFLPSIRSGVLMLVSQRTATELLTAEGKEKLAQDVLREASIPFGGGEEEAEETASPKKKKKKKVHVEYPVTAVLFSSFIVQ